jgi:hypothetical protein
MTGILIGNNVSRVWVVRGGASGNSDGLVMQRASHVMVLGASLTGNRGSDVVMDDVTHSIVANCKLTQRPESSPSGRSQLMAGTSRKI